MFDRAAFDAWVIRHVGYAIQSLVHTKCVRSSSLLLDFHVAELNNRFRSCMHITSCFREPFHEPWHTRRPARHCSPNPLMYPFFNSPLSAALLPVVPTIKSAQYGYVSHGDRQNAPCSSSPYFQPPLCIYVFRWVVLPSLRDLLSAGKFACPNC